MRKRDLILGIVALGLLALGLLATPRAKNRGAEEARRTTDWRVLVVPSGITIKAVLKTPLNTGTNRAGDHIQATVSSPVFAGERVAILAGSSLYGTVTEVKSAGRIKGRALISLTFNQVEVNGRHHPVECQWIKVGELSVSEQRLEATSEFKEDLLRLGITTATGTLLGKLTGHTKEGIVAGAAAGTAWVLLDKGNEIQIQKGTELTLLTTHPIRIYATP